MDAKVVIGTVRPDLIDGVFADCLAETLTQDPGYLPFRKRYLRERAPAGMLHVGRNSVVHQFLVHPLEPKYLLFIDTDMEWEPDQAWQLVESAEAHDIPAVNALVCMQGGRTVEETIPVMYDYDMNIVQPAEPMQRVFCGGSAFLLLRRDILDTVGAAHGWPTPWFNYEHRHGKAVTEEVIFCQRLWDLGIPMHVNTEIRIAHRKIHPFVTPVPAYLQAV